MKKIIVTTTINPPTEALKKFDCISGYELIVVGDKKTPKDFKLKNAYYVTPDEQEKRYPYLSELLGWNCIQRRNIGFLIALELGADVIATVDDDNIPNSDWGENLLIGRELNIRKYHTNELVFDPIGATNHNDLWHRGFPFELTLNRNYSDYEMVAVKNIMIQADFWNGDPDIDAICRMLKRPICNFDPQCFPFTSNAFSPFNSQNTFLAREMIMNYFMFPGIGRLDDIWGSYFLQSITGHRPVFSKASVFQERNQHDLMKDFSLEIIGYKNNLSLLQDLRINSLSMFKYLPGISIAAFNEYKKIAEKIT